MQGVAEPSFFVLYGDSYLTTGLGEVETAYKTQSAPVLMTVFRDREGLEKPNAVFDGTMVTRYEKGLQDPPAEMRYVDYGLSVWERGDRRVNGAAGRRGGSGGLVQDVE